MDKNIVTQLSDANDGHTFVIYPRISHIKSLNDQNGMAGNIMTPEKKWSLLLSKLSKSKCTNSTSKVYVYRDIAMNMVDQDNISIVHNKTVYTTIIDDLLLVILKKKALDSDSFPKLNLYHDEYKRDEKSYKFGYVFLNFVTTDRNGIENKHIEVCFQYKKLFKESILKDLGYVNKLLVTE